MKDSMPVQQERKNEAEESREGGRAGHNRAGQDRAGRGRVRQRKGYNKIIGLVKFKLRH